MKKIKLVALLFITFVLIINSIFLVSCNKNKNINTVTKQNSVPNKSISRFSNINNLDLVKQEAYEMHNSYLQNALIAYTNNELKFENSLTNINNQLAWSKNYFNSTNIDMQNWNNIENSIKQNYSSNKSMNSYNLENYNSIAPIALKNYTIKIVNSLQDMLNGNQNIDLNSVCEDVFTSMKSDNNLSNNNKIALASIIGVTEGSYSYWNGNIDNWNNLYPTPMSNRWKQIIGFCSADAMGALDGGATGSVLPGVGTAAGAVLGGALYSGMCAYAW